MCQQDVVRVSGLARCSGLSKVDMDWQFWVVATTDHTISLCLSRDEAINHLECGNHSDRYGWVG